jgi:hypothetical protein
MIKHSLNKLNRRPFRKISGSVTKTSLTHACLEASPFLSAHRLETEERANEISHFRLYPVIRQKKILPIWIFIDPEAGFD